LEAKKMDKFKNFLFCTLDNLSQETRENQRLTALEKLGLLNKKVIPVFDEATQIAVNFLEIPISLITVLGGDNLLIKSAVGLSHLGLMNDLAIRRKIPKHEAFSIYVIDSKSHLVIENTLTDSFFSRSILVQNYGICAYLGTPLITSEGECIGTLEVMDISPRNFTLKELEFLAMTARWCIGEYEKNQLLIREKIKNNQADNTPNLEEQNNNLIQSKEAIIPYFTDKLIAELLYKQIQKISTPLTSIIGMASVLKGEVYGQLTKKQKEYIEIIYNSGLEMNSLIESIISLTDFDNKTELIWGSVDLEMLTQQVINSLESLANKQEHKLNLSVEPGNKIWLLDKSKTKQTIYYLLVTVIESAHPGGEIQVHLSTKNKEINISIWVRHPWLDNAIPFEKIRLYSQFIALYCQEPTNNDCLDLEQNSLWDYSEHKEVFNLLFCCRLAKIQKGKILIRGSSELGYRFIFTLPIIDL
jgi:signal transduction histidine kinase